MSLREPASLPAPSSSVQGHILLSLSQTSVPFSSTHTLISCFPPAPHGLVLHTAHCCGGHSKMQVRSHSLVWPQLLMESRCHSSLLTKEYKVLWVFLFFWLLRVFTAARGLSLVAELGGYSRGCARARGRLLAVASRCGAGALGTQVSVVRARGL